MPTLADWLSLSRVALAPPLAWALIDGAPWPALGLLALAVASDLVDGPLARHRGQATPRGALLDHGSDAAFVTIATAACAYLGLLPPLLPPLIALAFIQYLLDSHALAGAPLRRSRLGRWNGIAYFVAVGLAVAAHLPGTGPAAWRIIQPLGWVLVATTAASIAVRAAHAARRRAG